MKKAVVLIELAKLTFNYLFKNLLGLICHLGILLHLFYKDSLFLCKNLCGNRVLIKILDRHSCGLKRNVLCALSELSLIGNVGVKAYDNAGSAKTVDVSRDSALDYRETTDGKLLTYSTCLLCESVAYAALALTLELARHKSVNVFGLIYDYSLKNVLNERLENCILSNEVGLRVNLNHSGGVADSHNINNTLSSDSASLLCYCCHALLAKDFYCCLKVTVCILERILTVHHSAAGLLSKLGYVLC